MFSVRQRLVLYLSILSVNFHSGASLVLTSRSSLTLPGNSTIHEQNTTSTGNLANDAAPHCVNHHDWKGDGIIMYDCRRLVHWFYSSILPRYEDVYEFVGPDFKPDDPDAVRTPTKYTYRMSAQLDMVQFFYCDFLMSLLFNRHVHSSHSHDDSRYRYA